MFDFDDANGFRVIAVLIQTRFIGVLKSGHDGGVELDILVHGDIQQFVHQFFKAERLVVCTDTVFTVVLTGSCH